MFVLFWPLMVYVDLSNLCVVTKYMSIDVIVCGMNV